MSRGAQPGPAKPLLDGTVLTGADGKLVPGGADDRWFFELVADVNSISGPVTAGTRFELLPCTTLELLIADVNDRYTPTYRLSARVTRYEGKSFLFPTYYLPLSKSKSAGSADEEKGQPMLSASLQKAASPTPNWRFRRKSSTSSRTAVSFAGRSVRAANRRPDPNCVKARPICSWTQSAGSRRQVHLQPPVSSLQPGLATRSSPMPSAGTSAGRGTNCCRAACWSRPCRSRRPRPSPSDSASRGSSRNSKAGSISCYKERYAPTATAILADKCL